MDSPPSEAVVPVEGREVRLKMKEDPAEVRAAEGAAGSLGFKLTGDR